MRLQMLSAVVVTATIVVPARAQTTPDLPVGEMQEYAADSGLIANPGPAQAVVFQESVKVAGAGWVRIYFGTVELAPGSFLRVTSLLDGEVQVLDRVSINTWGNTSAYFNGDAVTVELVAAPRTMGNRVQINELGVQTLAVFPVGGAGQCGICNADNRVPSSETWTARLMPSGCTASVWNEESCMVTAGHCVGGNMVVQFNVPNSLPNCVLVNPPVADQFPAMSAGAENGGPGNDWGVLNTGTNSLGEKPYERYGELRPIAGGPATAGAAVSLTGYGADQTCTLNQTQQTSDGTICTVSGSQYTFEVDLRGGNSGSALIHNDEIIGIATHCPCCNIATRVDRPVFEEVRSLCPPPPPTPIATGPVATGEPYLLVSPDSFGSWGQPFGGGNGLNEDRFNPVGTGGSQPVAFTAGTFVFSGGTARALLSLQPDWIALLGLGTLTTEITQPSVASDESGDGTNDKLVSAFDVTGTGFDLSVALTQTVEQAAGLGPPTVAVMTQEYVITNNSASPANLELVRVFDGDLIWTGDFTNDWVGTGTNSSALERYVFMQEPNLPAQAVTLSSPQGSAYFGGKNGVDPDDAGGSPPYGFGTDTQVWNTGGVPAGWRNNIAGVGYDTDGTSGSAPAGSVDPEDGYVGLEVPVSIPAGPGASTIVTFRHTFGAIEPLVIKPACPWDCDGTSDGIVSVTDLLALLGQYDPESPDICDGGSCDYDGSGCVDVVDLLKLLAHYDPDGLGCL